MNTPELIKLIEVLTPHVDKSPAASKLFERVVERLDLYLGGQRLVEREREKTLAEE